MSGFVKGVYAKDHGTAKKGDNRNFYKATFEALVKSGVLEKPKTKEPKKPEEPKK